VPTADRGLAVSGLAGQAGSFRLGPVSLAIAPGQVLAVLGPSGAGKTMLLETIAGLRPHRSGRISLAGTDITALPPERRRIGLVFQDAALFPHLSVAENIRFGPKARRQPPSPGTDSLLARLGITALAARSPRSLSGGERQRVALARALAIQPGLLLLDEPLSALDQPTREDLRALLSELLATLDIPAVHVTHDRDEAVGIGTDLAIINGGQLRQAGPASQVTAHPADPETARLLGWTELGPRLLPARRPDPRHAPGRQPGSRQPHRPGRADPPHPAPGPHHPGRRPAADRAPAAPRPRITAPATRRTDHRNDPPRQRPHLPRGTRDRLKQPAQHPATSTPCHCDVTPGGWVNRPSGRTRPPASRVLPAQTCRSSGARAARRRLL
jgi:ABC-type nitrate/sulfonate/bicarbonate transport system ATPase subunit